MSDQGLVTIESRHSVTATIDRLARAVEEAGLIVFARIDHAGNAAEAGIDLRPTELLIFGHPRGGTPLMQDRQTAAIDLPVKALAWQDDRGHVWLTWNDADWLATRHGLGPATDAAIAAIGDGQARLGSAATS